jgi:hypothetical protein
VAEFHRLPEHPGDRDDELRCSAGRQQRCHGNDFHDINFYSGFVARSQRGKSSGEEKDEAG